MKKLKCMIVEDESLTVMYMEDILEKAECEVVGVFDNGPAALEGIRTIEPDFILMDINIKGQIDGIQLSRDLVRLSDAQLIFVTAYNDDETRDEVEGLSPFAFIDKPFTSKRLEELVDNLREFYRKKSEPLDEVIYLGEEFCFDPCREEVCDSGEVLEVSRNDLTMIRVFALNRNKVLSYEQLLYMVDETKEINHRTLRSKVYHLRRKYPKLIIETVAQSGYVLKTAE